MNRLTEKILNELKNSSFWTQRTRISGNTIQGLECPECGDKSAWAYNDSPMAICCNRLSSCGVRTRTLELFHIRQEIEKEFKPTKSDPHRPAVEYLKSRGITNTLKGLKFQYWKNVRKISGAVMFPLGTDDSGKKVYNGRLFNPGEKGKTHNSGSTAGKFWKHPGIEYDPNKITYITEGIIDSLSIIELGHQAIAVIASGQDPVKLDLSFFKNLVLAFDSDLAGSKATKKWKAVYKEATAIMPDKGKDWNDLLQSGPLETVRKQFTENLPRYRVNAQLALAGNAREYAEIHKDFFSNVPGLFNFDGCTWYSFSKKRGDESYLIVERCGKFILDVLSFLKDSSNPDQPEYRYHLRITPKGNNRPVIATATGRDLATPRGIKEFLLTRAKVSFEAGANASTALATYVTGATQAPEVNQLSITGYQMRSRWYVFNSFAIDPNGKLHRPDKRGLYKFNHREWSKPPTHSTDKAINPAETGTSVQDIYELIYGAWGNNGTAAVAWMVAGWLVNQIKDKIGFFPFLSLHGDPASGKSALTVILNALQGHDGEGLPLSQLNTKKALARTISRESGRFTALLEDNQRNERAFDYSILLTGFNQGPLQLKAAFSNDNRTEEAPFLGSLLFVQNSEPFSGKAEKQRVISLQFEHSKLSEKSRIAYEQIVKIPLPELVRVMLLTLRQRKIFEDNWIREYQKAMDDMTEVDTRRILQNHALVLAFHRLFCMVHDIQHDLTEFMQDTAQTKCTTSAVKEYSLADHFFESLDLISKDKTAVCIHIDDELKRLYINLPAAEHLIRNSGGNYSYHDNLGKALMSHPAFIKNSHRHRFPGDPETDTSGRIKQRRAWIFDCTKL